MQNQIDVLIVDDRKENLIVLENIIENRELNIVKALSGEEALSLMFDYDFAVILLDVEMPIMNGFEVAEFMRGSEKTKNIPIIFITANRDQNYIFKGYESGAVDYISKPLEPKILNNKIKVFIEIYKQNRKLKEQSILLEKSLKEVAAAKEDLEIANRLKGQFLANTSHELRTPLNAIIGISKMMIKYNADNLNMEQKEGLDVIYKSGTRLLNLINDLLDISKIEAGKMEIHILPFSLKECLQQLTKIVEALLKNKKVEFEIVNEQYPEVIYSDERKIFQILLNLLSNACKFTEEGKVTLNVKVENSILYANVKDTGIGIKKEDEGKLFQLFSQIDGSISRKNYGTGLGLSLSKKLVELLEGEISFESIYGEGTEFSFKIPIKQKSSDEIFKDKRDSIDFEFIRKDMKKILIVDDEESSVITTKMMLRDNYMVYTAKDGKDAIEKCKDRKFDLILMDILMPEMNGVETFMKLREMKVESPILSMTGLTMEYSMEKIAKIGFDDYIAKPTSELELYKIIEKYISR